MQLAIDNYRVKDAERIPLNRWHVLELGIATRSANMPHMLSTCKCVSIKMQA